MYDFVRELFPICRSITGDGVRRTLAIIKREIPDLHVDEVASGTQAFDWTVPNEWSIRGGYIEDSAGHRIVDFADNNLHIVGYSTPIDATMELNELQRHLHSLPDQPDAIPYVTSYYKPRWGFCLADRQRKSLKPGKYRVVIDSTLQAGHLSYADYVLPGESRDEVLISTYVCHPSMANNELSGPAVAVWLAKSLMSLTTRRLTYRFVFVPETIGSIVYLSRHLEYLQQHVIAGFVITCVGDDRGYSLMPSREGTTLADRVAEHVLQHHVDNFTKYSFLQRGSDERQYCSVGVDLPVTSIMRSKYAAYDEYHTSLDNMDLISPQGLSGAYRLYSLCLRILEANRCYRTSGPCEPQLGRRGLYPTLSTKDSAAQVRSMMNFLAYADGQRDLLAIAEIIGVPAVELIPLAEQLLQADVLVAVSR